MAELFHHYRIYSTIMHVNNHITRVIVRWIVFFCVCVGLFLVNKKTEMGVSGKIKINRGITKYSKKLESVGVINQRVFNLLKT